MRQNNIKKYLIYILKFDLLQEIVYSGVGCLLFIFLFQLFPSKFHFKIPSTNENKYPKLILANYFFRLFFRFCSF